MILLEGMGGGNVICAFSSRIDGNMSLCYADTASFLENRRKFLSGLGIDYRHLVCAKQSHSGNISYVDEKSLGRGALSYQDAIADSDALVTDKKGLPLAVFTADCLSVFLYDFKNSAIGLVHAGWRSSRGKILFKTVELMKQLFKTQADDLAAAFGPCIRSCCYRVSEDFQRIFPQSVSERKGSYYLDLILENKRQAYEAGIQNDRIFDPGICTSCQNDKFFSYRREGEGCGRIMSVVMLG